MRQSYGLAFGTIAKRNVLPKAPGGLAQVLQAVVLGQIPPPVVHDATLEATPFRTWFAGRATCVPYLRDRVMGSPGDWRMLATSANGQPAAVVYVRDQQGDFRPYGVCVLTVNGAGVRRVTSFGDPSLVTMFGFQADKPGPARCD
jgi:hypothetical protein